MTSRTVSSGQVSSGLVLQPGDSLLVLSGGVATDILVNAGAAIEVDAGAVVSGDALFGMESIVGGLSVSDTVLSGGIMQATIPEHRARR